MSLDYGVDELNSFAKDKSLYYRVDEPDGFVVKLLSASTTLRGANSESRVCLRHNSFGRGPGHNSFGRELPGEGGQSQRLPDSPCSWYSFSGEQESLKDSIGE